MHTSLVFGDLLKLPMVKGVVLAPVVAYYPDEDTYRPDVMFTDSTAPIAVPLAPMCPPCPRRGTSRAPRFSRWWRPTRSLRGKSGAGLMCWNRLTRASTGANRTEGEVRQMGRPSP
jgi:hypothetical protein